MSLHLGNEIFDIFKMPIEGLQNHLFVQQVGILGFGLLGFIAERFFRLILDVHVFLV